MNCRFVFKVTFENIYRMIINLRSWLKWFLIYEKMIFNLSVERLAEFSTKWLFNLADEVSMYSYPTLLGWLFY